MAVQGGPAVSCRAVTKVYRVDSGPVVALDGVDLEVPAGRLTVIRGRSGSGKSTLLRLLACVDRPTSGAIVLGGEDVAAMTGRRRRRIRRRRLGYVHQIPAHNLLPYLTAAEQVRLAAGLRGADPATGHALLELVGLGGRESHYLDELSGGEQQRLAFAAAAVGTPALIVADEPTAELDRASAAALVAAMSELARSGVTVVATSHDPTVAAAADGMVTMENGAIASA